MSQTRQLLSVFIGLVNADESFELQHPRVPAGERTGLVNAITGDESPFQEALQHEANKQVIPTNLKSSELGSDIHRVSFVLAQVQDARILNFFHDRITAQLEGRGSEDDTRVAGRELLTTIGYQPPTGKEGTIEDLSAVTRQNLIMDTAIASARGYGQYAQQNDPDTIEDFPALELYRADERFHERGDPWYPPDSDGAIGWEDRWVEAAEDAEDEDAERVFNETGRMVALKSSGIWESLGSLWDDSLGNPWPPFAFNSGMRTVDVLWDDAVALGLLPSEKPDEREEEDEFTPEAIEEEGLKAEEDEAEEEVESFGGPFKVKSKVEDPTMLGALKSVLVGIATAAEGEFSL